MLKHDKKSCWYISLCFITNYAETIRLFSCIYEIYRTMKQSHKNVNELFFVTLCNRVVEVIVINRYMFISYNIILICDVSLWLLGVSMLSRTYGTNSHSAPHFLLAFPSLHVSFNTLLIIFWHVEWYWKINRFNFAKLT